MNSSETTLLAKKLLVKAAQQWLFINAPQNFAEDFKLINGNLKTNVSVEEDFQGVLLFVKNSEELKAGLPEIMPVIKSETIFWISYPKKSSAIKSDLEMKGSWKALEDLSYRIVSSASVDKTWTALRFKPKEKVTGSGMSNAAIQNNEYAAFIDVKNKIVTLPSDVQKLLETDGVAYAHYQKLAYSHKKEYVIWILSAKQEKTRASRVQKMIEKLLA